MTDQVDWEGELAVVIGRKCKRVSVDKALEFVAGYLVEESISVDNLFVILAMVFVHRRTAIPALAVSSVLLVLLTIQFAQWYWVS